jgi:hypothetical protein
MFTSPIVEINRELANRIDSEVRGNPMHPYKGKIVGIANGTVVMVGDTLGEVCSALRKIEPDNMKTYVLETGLDYSQTEYIWRCANAPHDVAVIPTQAKDRNRPIAIDSRPTSRNLFGDMNPFPRTPESTHFSSCDPHFIAGKIHYPFVEDEYEDPQARRSDSLSGDSGFDAGRTR